MSIKTVTRVCWGLTLLLYVVGMFLPLFADSGSAIFMVLPPFVFCLALFTFPGVLLLSDQFGPGIAFWVFGVVLPMSLAHPALWGSWWAYYRRKPMAATIASGIAAMLWLAPIWAMITSEVWSEMSDKIPVAGYWCTFLGMAGMWLLALLSRGAMRAEVQTIQAEEQAGRAAATVRDAKIAAQPTNWAEGHGDDPR